MCGQTGVCRRVNEHDDIIKIPGFLSALGGFNGLVRSVLVHRQDQDQE